MLNPKSTSLQQLELFTFLGKLLGMALRTRVILSLDLPSMFWKQLCDHAVTRADLRRIDHTLVHGVIEPLESCKVCCVHGWLSGWMNE
jgi:hypothetical protein